MIFNFARNLSDGWNLRPHDDVIKWKRFPRYWPFVREFQPSLWNSPYKGQWRGALMLSGDLRRHLAHSDVTVMLRFYDDLLLQLVADVRKMLTTKRYSTSLQITWKPFLFPPIWLWKTNICLDANSKAVNVFLLLHCCIIICVLWKLRQMED